MPDKNYLVIYNNSTQFHCRSNKKSKAHLPCFLICTLVRAIALPSPCPSRLPVLWRTTDTPVFTLHQWQRPAKCGALPLVHSTGVEPTAFAVGGRRSIQLRYECILAPISARKFILLFFFYRRLYENFYL